MESFELDKTGGSDGSENFEDFEDSEDSGESKDEMPPTVTDFQDLSYLSTSQYRPRSFLTSFFEHHSISNPPAGGGFRAVATRAVQSSVSQSVADAFTQTPASIRPSSSHQHLVNTDHPLPSVSTSGTYATAASHLSAGSGGYRYPSKRPTLTADNLHTARARNAGLITSGVYEDSDWSGFGRHVQFSADAKLPFTNIESIANTNRAVVEAVQCRGVRLARKTMLCHRRFTPEEALEEVRYLQQLSHRHVVRLVGSYTQGKYFSILTYPVAQCDLKTFLAEAESRTYESFMWNSLEKGLRCLSVAMEYIHAAGIKHMDIKPQNILVDYSDSNVRRSSDYSRRFPSRINFYITDFGISRVVQDLEGSKTDGPSQRTLMYCSPEVAAGKSYGRSSDIFSLGCVFAEMLTCIATKTQAEFRCYRADDGETFHENLTRVIEWINELSVLRWCGGEPERFLVKRMLEEKAEDRPTAVDLVMSLGPCSCYNSGPLPFERVSS